MVMKEPSERELKQARDFIDKLLREPKELEKWVDKVMTGWLKRKHYKRS
jgi:hypothetical protein